MCWGRCNPPRSRLTGSSEAACESLRVATRVAPSPTPLSLGGDRAWSESIPKRVGSRRARGGLRVCIVRLWVCGPPSGSILAGLLTRRHGVTRPAPAVLAGDISCYLHRAGDCCWWRMAFDNVAGMGSSIRCCPGLRRDGGRRRCRIAGARGRVAGTARCRGSVAWWCRLFVAGDRPSGGLFLSGDRAFAQLRASGACVRRAQWVIWGEVEPPWVIAGCLNDSSPHIALCGPGPSCK
jgi:hypothetical protein